MASPRTAMRSLRKRGSRRLRRGMLLASSEVITGDDAGSFGGDRGFFRQHHGNVIAHRVNAPTGFAFQGGVVGKQVNRFLANRTGQDIEQFFRNGHYALRWGQENSTKGKAEWPARLPLAMAQFPAAPFVRTHLT